MPTPRALAYRAALVGGVLVGAGDAPASTHVAGGDTNAGLEVGGAEGSARSGWPATLPPPTTTPPAPGAPIGGAASARRVRLAPAGSPWALRAGTVIDGTLVTGIRSDLPGTVVGQVSRDIRDSRTQRSILIPAGSRLIGSYDDRIARDQERLLVAWTRLILPDGRSMPLPGLALADRQGAAGAKDRVDAHGRATFGKALLLSLIGAGAQLSQPRQSSVFAAPSAGQVAAGAIGQELSDVALETIRRGMDRPPTITIRAGMPFAIVLPEDLVFDGPYEPAVPPAQQ